MKRWPLALTCWWLVGLVAACAEPPPPRAPLVAKPELVAVRVFVPSTAEVTSSDPECAEKVPGLRVETIELAKAALSKAGFSIVTDPKAEHDTKAAVRLSMASCGYTGGNGRGTIFLSLEPGASETCEFWLADTGGVWAEKLVRRLQEAPQILALAKSRVASEDAASTDAPEGAAGSAEKKPASGTGTFLTGSPHRNAYAFVVGIETYRDAPKAEGARRDAERFAAMAKSTLGVPAEQIETALDDGATRSDIATRLDWLGDIVPEGGRVYFFFSGHGAPDASAGTPYLLPYNGIPERLDKTAIRLQDVLDTLGKTKAAEVIAIVDACFSGAGGRSVLPKGARPLVRVQAEKPPARIVLLTGSSGAQISGPAPDGKGGLFTTVLTDALGHGKADIDGDGQVSLKELAEWVVPRVERAAKKQSREQLPSILLGQGMKPATLFLADGLPAQ